MNPVSPTRVIGGRYVVLAELGRGGMGIVWRAEDRVMGRHVAVKELHLPAGLGPDERRQFRDRLLREARTAGRLNDPGIVTVYDVVTDEGVDHIVMELIEAQTLADVVDANGPLDERSVVSLARQLLDALRVAHDNGVVHRDVKPSNVMLVPGGRVKLTDFGIAQAVDDPRLTTSGMIIGSPAFMAPERVAGKEAVPASDLWSLGAALFFAVEGLMAFERPTTAATLHAIMNDVPYLTRIQGPLASAIMGLLISSPDARISAAQAHQLLGLAANAQATPPGGYTAVWSGPAPTRVAPAPPKKRKPLWIGAAVAAVVLLAGGFLLGDLWGRPSADAALRQTMTYGPGGNIPTFEVGSYACTTVGVNDQRSITDDDWVDCKSLHYTELYDSATTYDASNSEAVKAEYPAKLNAWAEARCAMTFYSNSIPAQSRAALTYRALVPSPQGWEIPPESQYADYPMRKIYCLIAKADGQTMTGAVANDLK